MSNRIEKDESVRMEIVCPHCEKEFEIEASASCEVEDVTLNLQVDNVEAV